MPYYKAELFLRQTDSPVLEPKCNDGLENDSDSVDGQVSYMPDFRDVIGGKIHMTLECQDIT
jgi:hypothetical protein